MEIYKPSDDSLFFAEFLEGYLLKKQKKAVEELKYLDMGCGSCILAEATSKFFS